VNAHDGTFIVVRADARVAQRVGLALLADSP
jgi:hypothetical protein